MVRLRARASFSSEIRLMYRMRIQLYVEQILNIPMTNLITWDRYKLGDSLLDQNNI